MDLFESLPLEKKHKILQVCIQEFADHGYQDSSTNRIISQAGIAKGSLFKYFGSKEDLYFYILDHVANEIYQDLAPLMADMPADLLERLTYFARIELELHLQKPMYFKLFRRAQEEDGGIGPKVRAKYGAGSEASARQILSDINTDKLRYDKEPTIDVVLWFLKGLNEAFVAQMPDDTDPDWIRDQYLSRLETYMAIIKNGIYKD